MLLTELINKGIETISPLYPERETREMVYAFLEHHIGTKRHTHIIEPGYEVVDAVAAEALDAFGRMASGEPLQYVTGCAHFYGRQFHVTPDVLIPRPETELLCQSVLNHVASSHQVPASLKILDLCTGSGCIAWTLALELPGAEVTAVDISEGALKIASAQDFSEEIALTGAVAPAFTKADVLSGPSETFQKCDIIVSNPPYVMYKEKALMRPNVLEHEPHLALFVSDNDPLVFYRAVAEWASVLLMPGGIGIVEINEALGRETAQVYLDAGFHFAEVIRDFSERDRFVIFRR